MSLEAKATIEGLVFASSHPVNAKSIAEVLLMDPKDVAKVLEELQKEYSSTKHGMALVSVAGGYQFRTKSDLKEHLAKLYESKAPRLTQPTLEVLSIIAYKQPIIRPEIERIRGVDCTAVLKSLLERQLIEMKGRSDLPGHPVIYATTQKFLEWFQISSLEDLPPLSEMEALDRGAGGVENLLGLLDRDEGLTQESLEEIDETLKAVKPVKEIANPVE